VLVLLALAGDQSLASEAARDISAQTIVSKFPADADTRVHEVSPTTNFGSRVVLRVDGATDPDIESYLRFTVSGLAGSVQRATLRLHAVTLRLTEAGFRTTNGWSRVP
jgi:hypothetical protein